MPSRYILNQRSLEESPHELNKRAICVTQASSVFRLTHFYSHQGSQNLTSKGAIITARCQYVVRIQQGQRVMQSGTSESTLVFILNDLPLPLERKLQ